MTNITRKFAICAALFFVCLLPVEALAQDNHGHHRLFSQGHHHSGVIGQVEQVTGPWMIAIDSVDGRLITAIQADDSGLFGVDLKPGTYVLTPIFIPGVGTLPGKSATVTVKKSEFAIVELFIY